MSRLAVLSCLVMACAEPRTGKLTPAASKPSPSAALAGPPARALLSPEPRAGFALAIAGGHFRDAEQALAALPAEAAKAPEHRYALARVKMALRDFESARSLLDGLERELPLLADEVSRDAAECALTVGPFERAASYFGARADVESLAKAGLAFERAGDLGKARAALDRAVRVAGSSDDPETWVNLVRARAERARVTAALGDATAALADLRWLAVEAPATDEGRGAVTALSLRAPPVVLTADERFGRSRKLAEAGRLEDALAELDAISRAAPNTSALALLRARAQAHYLSRSSYPEAARLFEQASRAGGAEAAHDAFYSARSLARADEDAIAIDRYEAVASRFATSAFAEEARYQAARLRLLLSRWDDAISAYRRYLSAYGKGKGRFTAAARYELALALVSGKHPEEAPPLFRSLGDAEDSPVERAALRELEGVALADAGDRVHAADRLGGVVAERPLSFPALASAARLGAMGLPVPRLVPGTSSTKREPPLAVELPEKPALLAKLGLLEDAEQALRERESEIVQRHAPRGYEALCEAYGKIGAGAARYRVGRTAVKGDALDHAPTDDTRWAWECVYPEPFAEIVRAAEQRRSLPEGLLYAVMRQESAFRADAVSKANAVGLLQLIPGTAERAAREIGIDSEPELLRLPSHNVELGAYYLRKVLDTFGGHVAVAAAAYNAGPKAVSRWLERGEDLPLDLWVARIPFTETRGYVARVVGNLARYSYLRGGEALVPKLSLELPKGVRATAADY